VVARRRRGVFEAGGTLYPEPHKSVNNGAFVGQRENSSSSDACIYALKQRAAVLERLLSTSRADAGVSVITEAELRTGASKSSRKRREVNQMHEDYLALKGEARARLRYLLALLAKDLSQHAHRVPGAVEASEDVAAILALAERNLRGA